nr:hypothetical protein Iba_chr04eCG11110 [Ipomoea batatas]
MIGRNTPDGQICWICSLDSHVQTLYNLADYRALLSSLASRASTSSFDKRSTIEQSYRTTLVLLPYNLTKSTPAPPALLIAFKKILWCVQWIQRKHNQPRDANKESRSSYMYLNGLSNLCDKSWGKFQIVLESPLDATATPAVEDAGAQPGLEGEHTAPIVTQFFRKGRWLLCPDPI